MGDIGMEFMMIREALQKKHEAYIKRFGNAVSKHLGTDTIVMSRVFAKIKLLSRALVASGAIDQVEEQNVCSRDGDFPMSLRLGKSGSSHSIYLLNQGGNVIVSSSVGSASKLGSIGGRMSLTLDDHKICKEFSGILDESFDWQKFSMFVLDTIHETIYSKHEVLMESVLKDDDGGPSKRNPSLGYGSLSVVCPIS